MNLIKPKSLECGDTIAIIAPAGNVDSKKIQTAVKYFETKGFKIALGKNLFKENRYFAGTDEERLEDLHNAFLNPEVKAIVCARGGYGSIRLLDKIDYSIIKNNPKIFCGYSDITALSLIFLKEASLITYSGAMAQGDFGIKKVNKFTENSFWNVLSGNKETYKAEKTILEDEASGIIWGGNLSTIVSLCGINCGNKKTSLIPNQKFIFIVEDLAEPVYKIDKMFRQLLNIKEFRNNISGLAIGEFLDVDNKEWFEELIKEISEELNVPTYSGFKFSHAEEKQTVPIGETGYLSGRTLTF